MPEAAYLVRSRLAAHDSQSTYLNKPRVNENSCAERVEDAADYAGGCAAGIVRLANAETNGDANRCDDTKKRGTDDGHDIVPTG